MTRAVLLSVALIFLAACGAVRDRGTPAIEPPPVAEPALPVREVEPPPVAIARPPAPPRVSDAEILLNYFATVRRIPAAELAREHESARQAYAKSRSDSNRVRYAIVLTVPATGFNDDVRAFEAIEPLLKNPEAPLYAIASVVNAQIQEQRRTAGLQQKLEALMSLDKSLLEREQAAPKRR
jgi:hypothetical protein